MISTLFIASLAVVTPTSSESPTSATASRCKIQQVHLPAGKIGPITTIERCKKHSEMVSQEAGPEAGKRSGRVRN